MFVGVVVLGMVLLPFAVAPLAALPRDVRHGAAAARRWRAGAAARQSGGVLRPHPHPGQPGDRHLPVRTGGGGRCRPGCWRGRRWDSRSGWAARMIVAASLFSGRLGERRA
ncbi:MAG: hypothetical protein MZW92_78325 [Comamonadaceae bacterium]|nr:hypothetical protein [Comamonadaceae bacterium]